MYALYAWYTGENELVPYLGKGRVISAYLAGLCPQIGYYVPLSFIGRACLFYIEMDTFVTFLGLL